MIHEAKNVFLPSLEGGAAMNRAGADRGVDLKKYIRDIPDFPSPGILFRDITPLLKDASAFREVVRRLSEYCEQKRAEAIVGIDARGFLFASPLAYNLGKPLVPVRKLGKLPYDTHKVSYGLEYGDDTVEVHTDAIPEGQNVVIIDDLLATGGTMAAAAELVERTGGQIAGIGVVVELCDLGGRDLLGRYDLLSLVRY